MFNLLDKKDFLSSIFDLAIHVRVVYKH